MGYQAGPLFQFFTDLYGASGREKENMYLESDRILNLGGCFLNKWPSNIPGLLTVDPAIDGPYA